MSRLSDAASDYLNNLSEVDILNAKLRIAESNLENAESSLFQAIDGGTPPELLISHEDKVALIHLDWCEGNVISVSYPQMV